MATTDPKDTRQPPVNVVVQDDEAHRKVFLVSRGDESWRIIVDRQFVDNYCALWRWYFWDDAEWSRLSTALYLPPGFRKPPDPTWPTWEQALEDALNTLVPIEGQS